MIHSLFPASETSQLSEDYGQETTAQHEDHKPADATVAVTAGEAFFMPEEEEYFAFEI